MSFEIWHAVVLGLVEGITEYLPISSTGHLIIAADLMKLDTPELRESVKAFNIVVQGGAILAVVGLYWPRFVQMLRGLTGRDTAGLNLLVCLGIAFMPAAIAGVLLNDFIEKYLFSVSTVAIALVIGGLYMIVLEWWRRGKFSLPPHQKSQLGLEDITPVKALQIGLLQCIAMWPGTSRSMMTITGGYLVGLRPAAAAEFSFLLGVPTLTAACGYRLFKNLKHAHEVNLPNMIETLGVIPIVVGVVVAAVSAAAAVKFLVGTLNRSGLTPFGAYRIVLAIVLLGLVMQGIVSVNKS